MSVENPSNTRLSCAVSLRKTYRGIGVSTVLVDAWLVQMILDGNLSGPHSEYIAPIVGLAGLAFVHFTSGRAVREKNRIIKEELIRQSS